MPEQTMKVRAERIDELMGELDAIADPHVQSVARELLQSVTELHADGLARVLEILSDSPCAQVIDQLGDDERVGPLMALHGLHPLDLSERVARAVVKARATLEKHGGEAELLGVDDGNVRVRLRSQPQGCGSTADTLRTALEDAIYNGAPDLISLEIEEQVLPQSSFVPLEALIGSIA
jgi:Fe-S cluster biogenesis protein NfuA